MQVTLLFGYFSLFCQLHSQNIKLKSIGVFFMFSFYYFLYTRLNLVTVQVERPELWAAL